LIAASEEHYARDMDARYETHIASLEEHRKWFHPLRRIPLELLGRIFEQCVFDKHYVSEDTFWEFEVYSDFLDPGICAVQLPFTVARVCQHWRRAALSTASIWTYIDVLLNTDLPAEGWPPKTPPWLALKIERAKSAPWSLTIHRLSEDAPQYRHILNMLCDIIPRIRFLGVRMDGVALNDSLDVILGRALPNLERLMLYDAKPGAPLSSGWFQHAPKLNNVLEANLVARTPFQVAEKIVRVSPSVGDIKHILDTSPRLLRLVISYPDLSTAVLTQQFRHTTLVELIIYPNVDGKNGGGIEQILDLPALSKLALCGYSDPSYWLPFLRNISARFPRLLELEVDAFAVADHEELFAALPSVSLVQTLTLCHLTLNGRSSQALFQALSPRGQDHAWPCPQLERLRLPRCNFDDTCTGAEFLDFAKKRISAASDQVRRLQQLQVDGWHRGDHTPGPVFRDQLDALFAKP
jgi:hypothetical protein